MAIKKVDPFYEKLQTLAAEILAAAEDYAKLLHGYPDTFSMIPLMKVHETTADKYVGSIMKQLYTSFITPFDRGDISDLALAMDDIVDNMQGVSIRLDLFNIQKIRPEAVQLADLTLEAAREFKTLIDLLPDYKKDSRVMEQALKLSDLEDAGDAAYHEGIRRLFADDKRAGRECVTWLRLFDRMEGCLDSCDDAAGIIRSVVMKSA